MTTRGHVTAPPTATARLLTVSEVADTLSCGRTLVYELLGKGEIGHIKIGRLTRVHPAQVEHFLRRRMGLDCVEAPSRRPSRQQRISRGAPTLPFDG